MKMTFTGIDAKTDIGWIKAMGRKYVAPSGVSKVEFAILRSPKAGQSARYPNRDQVKRITDYVYPEQLAFHLCGEYARMVHEDRWGELQDIIDFRLVSRVQVNSALSSAEDILRLARFSIHIDKPVIMQWREKIFPYVPVISLLQDMSGGTGAEAEKWFIPSSLAQKARMTIGYAGGLKPENFKEQLHSMSKASCGLSFWTDCESGVRTDDWFDTDKAESMMADMFEFRKWPTREKT